MAGRISPLALPGVRAPRFPRRTFSRAGLRWSGSFQDEPGAGKQQPDALAFPPGRSGVTFFVYGRRSPLRRGERPPLPRLAGQREEILLEADARRSYLACRRSLLGLAGRDSRLGGEAGGLHRHLQLLRLRRALPEAGTLPSPSEGGHLQSAVGLFRNFLGAVLFLLSAGARNSPLAGREAGRPERGQI